MNKTRTILSTVALATACMLAQAQDTAPTQRVEIGASRAAVDAARAALHAGLQEARFEMSNGRRLLVTSLGDSLRVRYGQNRPVTLTHDGAGNFVARDGVLSLRFELDGGGDPSTVHVTMPVTWF